MNSRSLKNSTPAAPSLLQAYEMAANHACIVSITDSSDNIIYVNANFLAASGYRQEEIIGQTHRIINSGYHSPGFFAGIWQTISSGRQWQGEMKNKAKDGSYFWTSGSITPITDERGSISSYLCVHHLVTGEKQNEQKLLQAQAQIIKKKQQLKEAQRVAKTGSWFRNTSSNEIRWADETYHIFELPLHTAITYETFFDHVYPADRPLLTEAWDIALKNGNYDIEHRITTKSGIKWVRERAHFEFDSELNLKTALGTVQDITEKKQTENALKESEQLYKTLFNNSPFSIGIMEKKSLHFLEINNTGTELYGYSREEFLRLNIFDIREQKEHALIRDQLSAGSYAMDTTVRIHRKKNGDLIMVKPCITEILYKGKPVYLVTIRDLTEKIRTRRELHLAKINRQKDILQALEESRSAIGRELHDNINQLLVAAGLYIKSIKPTTAQDELMLKTGLGIMANANEEIRKLSAAMVAPSLKDISLADSIEALSQNLKLANIKVELETITCENTLPAGFKINIYRIIQEQINNIIKYAGASTVRIAMLQSAGLLTLEIYDNGKGFVMDKKGKGIGLKNIAYRAEAYNGKATIKTSPGNGCRVYVEFVLEKEDGG